MLNLPEKEIIRGKYSCLDVIYPFEIAEKQMGLLSNLGEKQREFYEFQIHEVAPVINKIMARGVKIDLEKKEKLYSELLKLSESVEAKLSYVVGEEFNPRSNLQIKRLFKDLLKIRTVTAKLSGNDTFGSEAMVVYKNENPLISPLITLLLEYRSIKIFLSTFLGAKVSEDGRMRTAYNVAGTNTYRLSSRKNGFKEGLNLQNVPSKGKIDLKFSFEKTDDYEENNYVDLYGETQLPNCKTIFIPDEGYTFFDVDYSGADAMVVAWDANCTWLKHFFKTSDIKLYQYIGQDYLQRELSKEEPWYLAFKQFVHLTNYGGTAEKAGISAGIPVKEARRIQRMYFKLCPELAEWHKKIKNDVLTKGFVENVFGARMYFVDKKDPTWHNKAIATIPQSTIAVMVNKGIVAIEKEGERIRAGREDLLVYKPKNISWSEWISLEAFKKPPEVLMQVHDSAAGQFLSSDKSAKERIVKHMTIPIYGGELAIPAEIKTSEVSYGDCGQ